MPGCPNCLTEIAPEDRVGVMWGRVMGDSVGDLWYRCPGCGMYAKQSIRESFTTGDHESWTGPYTEGQVRSKLELIGQCGAPGDDRCRCDAHQAYFGNLD